MTNPIRALSLKDLRARASGRVIAPGHDEYHDEYGAARVPAQPAADMVKPISDRKMYAAEEQDANHHLTAGPGAFFIDRVGLDEAKATTEATKTSNTPIRGAQHGEFGVATSSAPADATANAHRSSRITDNLSSFDRGYAPIGDLRMYYEIHGSGDTPLLLLHGGLFNIHLQFGELIPGLAARSRVVAAEFQGHGRTNDIDRPLRTEDLASDVVGLLDHLGIATADVFGFSIGGAVALYLAIRHPNRVRKLVVSSVSFHPDGDRTDGEGSGAAGAMTVDLIAGTPMEQEYVAKSPHPGRLQELLDKLGAYDEGAAGWSEDDIRGIGAPTLITVGDCDAVELDHAVRFLQLRGGDVNGDIAGVPASQLAVFPGTTHFSGLARTALVLDVVGTFLDTPAPQGAA